MTRRFEAVVQRAVEASELKRHTDGRTLYRAVATTPALDRYGEVVLPKGAVVENFLKNPVMLGSHNYMASSVGHVVNLELGADQMVFEFVFSEDAAGQELESKFKAGDMNAFSIGFKPKAVVNLWNPWEDAPEIKEIKVEYPDGSDGTVDLTRYEHVPYRIYNKWELLEISAVSVPANPEALLLRQAEDIIRRVSEQNPVMRSFVQDELASKLGPVMRALAKFTDDFEEVEIHGKIAPHTTPVADDEWSVSVAKAALAKWASKGETGKKEDMNWAKFSKGFAEFDSKQADNFGAYKLPHHTVKDSALIAVWKGVTAAMAALLGTRGAVAIDDKGSAYSHLAAHYKDFGKEAPELKEYSDEELTAIEEEPLVVQKADPPPADNPEGVEKADDTDEGSDGEDDETPSNMSAMMRNMMDVLKQILDGVNALSAKEDEDSETQEEAFIQLQLTVQRIENALEYAGLKGQKKVEEKKVEKKEVVGEVPASLVAALERVERL